MEIEQLDPSMLEADPNANPEKKVDRSEPEPGESTQAFISDWFKKIDAAEAFHEPTFVQMKASAKFAAGYQWKNQRLVDDDRYKANITLRHINQRVAAIYAKNPKVRAERKQKLWHKIWDGTPEMLNEATVAVAKFENPEEVMQMVEMRVMKDSGMEINMARALLMEAQQTIQKKDQLDKMGKTLELVAQYSMDETNPRFKTQLKQAVRRVLTCKVAFIKVGYQREMEPTAEIDAKIKDDTDRLLHLENLAADLEDGEIDANSKEAEELRIGIEELQDKRDIVLREGLVFSFPKSWGIIIDPACIQLKGFIGAGWVAEKYMFTKRQVQEIYGVALNKGGYTSYNVEGRKFDNRSKSEDYCSVYEIYDLIGQLCFTLIRGYKDYVKDPGAADVDIQQFHPYFTLTFNDIEAEETIYPPSDVELVKPIALEYNRCREALRQHRIANTPAMMVTNGVFNKKDLDIISTHLPNEIIQTKLSKQDDINKVMKAKPVAAIAPELYDTSEVFTDFRRTVGTNEEELGNVSRVSATASSIAEGAKATGISSNTDDLDEFLTDIWNAAGQVLLLEMSPETVVEIAGEGSIWPSIEREEASKQVMLTIKAGSSGRPNSQQRMVKLEKIMPFILQMPNMDPMKIAEMQLREFDENLDIEDFLKDGTPSIVAQNQLARPGLGAEGGNNPATGGGSANASKAPGSPAKEQNTNPAGAESEKAA